MTTHQPSLPVDLLVEELRLAAMSLFIAQRGFERHGLTELAEQVEPLLNGVRAVIGESDPGETALLTMPTGQDSDSVTSDQAAQLLRAFTEITMQVTVRDHAKETGSGWTSPVTRTVTISVFCPACGARRGEPLGWNACDDGAYYWVQVWNNPCRHRDMYHQLVDEASRLDGLVARVTGDGPERAAQAFSVPRTPAAMRFFVLRESGYTGPIDQDGVPVTDGPSAEILAHLAQIPATTEVTW